MRKIKIAINISIALILFLGAFLIFYESVNYHNSVSYGPQSGGHVERIDITNVHADTAQNAVFVDVTTPDSEHIKITNAIFTDANDTIVENDNLSFPLLQGQSATLRINYTLASGNYTAKLVTARGTAFLLPSFIVP